MNNYRSEYENYYRNINKSKGSNKYITSGKKNDYKIHSSYDDVNKYFTIDYWTRRIIFELSGSLVVLSCFLCLKCIPTSEARNAYKWCKQSIDSNFNYDATVEAFNAVEIGSFKTKDLKIGEFTIEDLKYENLKNNLINFSEYLKSKMNIEK